MSAQVIQSITLPPVKRMRTDGTPFTDNMFKCGEVFVTNCADKWTFYCSHCQLATTDVGVFVCHIRLQHMNDEATTTTTLAQETPRNSTPITIASSRQNVAVLTPAPPATSIPIENLLPSEIATAKDRDESEQMRTEIIKEEPNVSVNQSICSQVSKIVDISSLTQPEGNNETPAAVNENNESTKEDIFTITEIKLETQDFLSFENENEANESDKEEEEEELYENDSATSYYNPKVDSEAQEDGYYLDSKEDSNKDFNDSSEKNIDLDSEFVAVDNDKDNKPSSSKAIRKNAAVGIQKYNCLYCDKLFNSKRALNYHIKRSHFENNPERLLHKCPLCPQSFQTKTILNFHQKTHNNERYKFNCPICPLTGFKENDFVAHVQQHESETCFPCQVCGKIFASQVERMKHWKTHAKEKPYYCRYCYRRFAKQYYLMHHLKLKCVKVP